jgi:hypothetical protein
LTKNPLALISEKGLASKGLMKMGDFDVCNKKKPMNITIKGKMQQS